MNLLFSIFIFLLLVFFILSQNYKGQLVLIILSLVGNMFYFDIAGTRVLLFQMTALLALPSYFSFDFRFLNKIIRGIRLEYIILIFLGLIFGLIIPWEDNSTSRTWSQLAGGRSIVALIRIIIELLLIYYIYKLFKANKISNVFLINCVSIVIIISTIFSFIDYAFSHNIYKFLFSASEYKSVLDSRFLGFSHEPRSFGRLTLVPWLIILIFRLNNIYNRTSLIAIILGFISIVISISFSTYIMFFLAVLVLLFIRSNRVNLVKSFLTILTLFFSIFIAFQIVSRTEYFKVGIKYRYDLVTQGKVGFQMKDEPYIFTSFEVFDRAALNFFYNNPRYIFFGTGPNLISIPASKYLDKSAILTYERTMVGIPGIGIINHISRAGLIGLTLYLLVFFKINKILRKSTNKTYKEIFIVVSSIYLIIGNPWIYFVIGYVIAEAQKPVKLIPR